MTFLLILILVPSVLFNLLALLRLRSISEKRKLCSLVLTGPEVSELANLQKREPFKTVTLSQKEDGSLLVQRGEALPTDGYVGSQRA